MKANLTSAETINLDAIGRMGALAFQYTALLMQDERGAAVIRNDLRHDLGAADTEAMRSDLMDRLVEAWRAAGGTGGRAAFERYLSTLWGAARDWADADGRNYGH